ncbi:OLC1v1022718C1 [Oldenlandia corymbosa var. corymbosa]|uniref:OLC1v1022718C1 n=1 Tax=Oldenlandia corymbosa var. corymbosa TaxID=529605 RepID=A0AAV1C0W3_OLDCO|nr:OLC1v1022718C1 [Oldenlandia corymbosa var. corymbosa]
MTDDVSKYHHSVCSSSKFPLNGHGSHVFLASQAAKRLNETKSKNQGSSSASIDKEVSGNKVLFPELHVSPLRRFQLIESDSDEASPSKGPSEVINKVSLPSSGQFTSCKVGTSAELKKTKAPEIMSPANDLWKEISSDRSFHVPTPALDEFCEEYSRSLNNKGKSLKFEKACYVSNKLGENEGEQIASGPPHPAYLYYYHEDSRIQELVRTRLPHFLPLCCVNNQGLKQQNTSTINYTTQFNHKEASKQGKRNQNIGSSSTKSRKNARKSSAVDVQEESDSWINPRVSKETTKDAGKKRVRGVESAGHWYTGPNGRRVYVTGNGQELSGQAAYRRYKRESGGAFKKSNKKAASKKKSGKKKRGHSCT